MARSFLLIALEGPIRFSCNTFLRSVINVELRSIFELLRLIKDKPYEIRRRGQIAVKGKGTMVTYFVIKHLRKIPAELVGLSDTERLDKLPGHMLDWDLDSVPKNRSRLLDYFNPAKSCGNHAKKSSICTLI